MVQLPLQIVVLASHLGQLALYVLATSRIREHVAQRSASGFQLGEEGALAFQLALQVLEELGKLYKLDI